MIRLGQGGGNKRSKDSEFIGILESEKIGKNSKIYERICSFKKRRGIKCIKGII